jgi:hypothetical protein
MKTEEQIKADFDLSQAIRRHIRAKKAFESAQREMMESCDSLKEHLGANAEVVANIDLETFIIKSDDAGRLEVRKVKAIN